MHKIYNFFFKNLFAKLVCLFLAISLLIYVGAGQAKNTTFPSNIPLELRNVPQGLVAVSDTDTITVKIIASSDAFQKLTNESFTAYIDLNGLKEGTYNLKPQVTVNLANVAITETNPGEVVVSLEPSIQKEVPIATQITGKAGDGLVPGAPTADPGHATATGARSLINSLISAMAPIQLTGQTSDFKTTVKLQAFDSQGKAMKGVTFSPQSAIINVPIVKASNVKTIGIKVNITGNPSPGYWISEITTDPTTVTVTASDATIAALNYITTASVSVDGLSKNTILATTLAPPSGVSVLDNLPQIKVTVNISKNQSTKSINVGYKWSGLGTNLKVTSVEPQTVTLVVTGPQDILSSLSSGDVAIIVDLSGRNTPGTYSVDISRANISGPPGVSVSSIVPSAINVRLDTL